MGDDPGERNRQIPFLAFAPGTLMELSAWATTLSSSR